MMEHARRIKLQKDMNKQIFFFCIQHVQTKTNMILIDNNNNNALY